MRREAGDLVGLDWGVATLATLSTGDRIGNPRFGAAAAAVLRRLSAALARARKGSWRRMKTKANRGGLQRKLANRRKSCLHRVSAALARALRCDRARTAAGDPT